MKKLLSSMAVILSLMVCPVAFGEVAVIVNPSNAGVLDADAIVKIFLGKAKSFSDGETAIPVTQGGVVDEEFNSKILNKSSSQVKAYWSKLVFTGKGSPPKELENDAEVKKMVANNPNIIGYIDAAQVDGSVKVVLTL